MVKMVKCWHLEHEGPGELVEHGVGVVVGGGGHVAQALPWGEEVTTVHGKYVKT